MFTFSALAGYSISAVIVDGMPLTQEQIATGSYTFRNVLSNHSIEVWSTAYSAIILTIEVVEGEGYAMFSVNGGPLQEYVSDVLLPDRAYLTVEAFAADGYQFKEWRAGTTVYSSPETSFPDVRASIHLELYFKEKSSSGWDTGPTLWVALILLLLLLGLLLLFLLYGRRRYDVFIQEFSAITGEDKTKRKKAYSFTVGGGYMGGISYRVGEEGQWKMLLPDEEGIYTIPKNEVTGDIYLEDRPA
jgi:hypothetical protein